MCWLFSKVPFVFFCFIPSLSAVSPKVYIKRSLNNEKNYKIQQKNISEMLLPDSAFSIRRQHFYNDSCPKGLNFSILLPSISAPNVVAVFGFPNPAPTFWQKLMPKTLEFFKFIPYYFCTKCCCRVRHPQSGNNILKMTYDPKVWIFEIYYLLFLHQKLLPCSASPIRQQHFDKDICPKK